MEIFKERLNRKILELYYNLYKNPWFFIKKNIFKKYYLINIIIYINKIII